MKGSGAYLGTMPVVEFLMLTAVRSGEGRNARWEQIDRNGAVWTIPAERMEAGREYPSQLLWIEHDGTVLVGRILPVLDSELVVERWRSEALGRCRRSTPSRSIPLGAIGRASLSR